MSRHSFDPDIAAQVGLNAAVIYQNLTFWVEKNQANRTNFRKGRYWTYNSISAFAELFTYLTEKQIRTALNKLLESGLILKGHFCADRSDRTTWWTLNTDICPDGQMDVTEKATDAFAQKGKPIAPEGKSIKNRYKPDNKPYPLHEDAGVAAVDLENIWLAYPEDRRRNKSACFNHIRTALNKVSPVELLAAVSAYANESANFTRSKVCFADNWFRREEWRQFPEEERAQSELNELAWAKLVAHAAEWIKDKSPLCRHLSAEYTNAAIEAGLLTRQQVAEAGVRL